MTMLVANTTLYVVLRGSFDADGIQRERGEILDTEKWRNVKPLVDARYLAAITTAALETIVDCPCGRQWIDQEASDRHRCPARLGAKEEV